MMRLLSCVLIRRIVTQRTKKDGSPSKQYNVDFEFVCDYCNTIYQRKGEKCTSARLAKTNLTFCSNNCKYNSNKKYGKLHIITSQNLFELYGVTEIFTSEEIKQKSKETFQERYGVSSPLAVPEFKQKRNETMIKNHGVPETFQSKELCNIRRKTWIKNYNQPIPPQALAAAKLAIETQPIKWSSKLELEFCYFLQKYFLDVKHQKWIYKWPVDFYIASINTYVQFDGIYWHGLDRPLDIIKNSTKVRDKVIFAKWINDREQDSWFAEANLRLIRITDVQYKNCKDDISREKLIKIISG